MRASGALCVLAAHPKYQAILHNFPPDSGDMHVGERHCRVLAAEGTPHVPHSARRKVPSPLLHGETEAPQSFEDGTRPFLRPSPVECEDAVPDEPLDHSCRCAWTCRSPWCQCRLPMPRRPASLAPTPRAFLPASRAQGEETPAAVVGEFVAASVAPLICFGQSFPGCQGPFLALGNGGRVCTTGTMLAPRICQSCSTARAVRCPHS